jgi:3-deoxy-7-phosphoheptulonate synthase
VVNAKLAIRQNPEHRTTVPVGTNAICGGKELLIVGGPCSVESLDQMSAVAEQLKKAPVQALRGGVFKPRTSPYAFQGMGQEGLDVLSQIRAISGLPVITEVMSIEQIKPAQLAADVLQIGSRNMQNFELLKALGQATKPILLKRGLSATIEEFVLAAEYIMAHGNSQVILCERGIRSYDNYTRNVLDLGAVVALRQMSHLPVIVDPSHACGRREMVADLARAAIACGADGLLIECHPDPDRSVSDARQTISLESMLDLVESLKPIAHAVGRIVIEHEEDADDHAIKLIKGDTISSSQNKANQKDKKTIAAGR